MTNDSSPALPRRFVFFAIIACCTLAGWLYWLGDQGGHDESPAWRDMTTLRNLGQTLIAVGCPLGEDGYVDPYAVLRTGDLSSSDTLMLCASIRQNKAPTREQIKAGDYSDFPWERHWGPVDHNRMVPFLWEKDAGKDGHRIVAFTNGTIKLLSNENWNQKWASLAPRPPK